MDTTVETYYELVYLTTGSRWRLSRVVDGTLLEIGSYSQTLTPATSYVAKLEMVGTVINAYIDGTLRIAADDSAAPITAKGKAGIKGGGLAVTTTTGLHFDTLTATDFAAPASTITYVGVGTAASVTNSGTVSPSLPAGLATDDLMVAVAYEKSSSGNFTAPAGWTQAAAPVGNGKSRVWTRFYVTGDTAPAIGITSNSTGGITQVAAFRGVDKTTAVDVVGAVASGTTANDIGPITGITPSVSGALVVVVGGRQRDWTSVATLSGDSLTWNEIAEPDAAPTGATAIGLVWDYAIFAGAPTAVTSKTFAVTSPGGTGSWHGYMLAFRPATTVAAPATNPTKVKIAGVFVTKVMKRKAGGTFATKPMKAMSDHPPPPPPTGGGATYTLTPVSVANKAMPLTYSAAPPTYFIFPASEVNSARPLSYQFHPPPADSGQRVLMWEGYSNMISTAESSFQTLRSYGVDGFYVSCQYMQNMGSNVANWIPKLEWCKAFADAHPEFKVYVGCHLNNYMKNWTPCAEWNDDATWTNDVLPNFATVAHAIADSRLAGLGLDGEDYKGVSSTPTDNRTANGWLWTTRNPSATFGSYTEAQIRAKVKERAKSIADTMTAIAGPFDVAEYYLYLPGSFREYQALNNNEQPFDDRVSADWIDGWTSNSQITFRHVDAAYYKPRLAGLDWDQAYAMDKANYNGSPQLRKSNSFHTPFIWITEGPRARQLRAAGQSTGNASDRQYSAAEVALQLQKARLNAEGGEFALYDQGYIDPPNAYVANSADILSAST